MNPTSPSSTGEILEHGKARSKSVGAIPTVEAAVVKDEEEDEDEDLFIVISSSSRASKTSTTSSMSTMGSEMEVTPLHLMTYDRTHEEYHAPSDDLDTIREVSESIMSLTPQSGTRNPPSKQSRAKIRSVGSVSPLPLEKVFEGDEYRKE